MSGHTHGARSLIERAAEVYDFGAALRGEGTRPVLSERSGGILPSEVEANSSTSRIFLPDPSTVLGHAPRLHPGTGSRSPGRTGTIDKARLRADGFILPEAPIGALAEEFRLVKRQLLLRTGAEHAHPTAKDRMILVCSAQPNEGKTFCAVNLALSLASERDNEVLLVDADVAKPEVLSTLGLEGEGGLIDAIADPHIDVESLVIATDIPTLSVLPAGRATHNDTELLSSARAAQVIASLAESNPRRIVILDSAPALAASPAAVLAHRVGRVLMIVRADRTTEGNLRDAIALLDGCPDIALLLNASSFFATNRTYGSYYGAEA